MVNTIEEGSKGFLTTVEKRAITWKKRMSEREARIRAGTHKKFDSFSQMNRWVNSELNQRLYKIKEIDWEKGLVAVEPRPIKMEVTTA